MKILFLSTWFPYPPSNGSEIRAYYLVRNLARSHEVTLVAFCHKKKATSSESSASESPVSIYPVPVDPFRYVQIPQVLKFASPIPVACWPNKLMRQTVSQVAGLGHWDAVVAFQSPVARYALLLPYVPRVLDVDTAYSYQAYERYASRTGFTGRFRTWASWWKTHRYETRLFRRFQTCTVVSPMELAHLRDMTGATNSRCEVVSNGVDCQHNYPGIVQPLPKSLVYNGALTYSANYQAMQYFLDEVYPRIKEQEPDVSLTITGSTAGVNLSGLRLDDSVRLSGYVDDIRLLVAGAWVCVVPIRQGGGTRLKILEAMALGTPVVATSKGAEGLDVATNTHLLLGDTSEAFADAVLRMMRDSNLRKRLRRNARALVEQRYDWETIGEQFVTLVEETVKGQMGKLPSPQMSK